MQYTLINDVLMMREDESQEWRPAPVTRWEEGARAIIAQQPKSNFNPQQTFSRRFKATVLNKD